MSVIYLLSALPGLRIGQMPEIGADAFLERTEDWLPRDEYEDIKALVQGRWREVKHPFGAEWGCIVELLRAVKASERKRLRGLEEPEAGQHWPSRIDLGRIRQVAQAFEEPHPLARERALDRIEWEALDELEGVDPHDIRRVFSYGLKLPIAQRWALRSPQKGMDRLHAWLDAHAQHPNTITMEHT